MLALSIATRLYNPQLIDPFNTYTSGQYATRIIEIMILILFIASVLAFFFMFIWGGVQWITSGGGKQQLEEARSRIANGITGLMVLFLLFVAIRLTNTVFGINFAGWGGMVGGGGGGGGGVTPTSTSGLPGGSSCTLGSQCASGFCGTSVDSDGDGFFAEGAGRCTSSPTDCNDVNAQVFPGQTNYFENPIAGSVNDYNYDCADGDGDGNPNDIWPRLNCMPQKTGYGMCQTAPLDSVTLSQYTGWTNHIPACGEQLGVNSFYTCAGTHLASCVLNPAISDVTCFAYCPTGLSCGWGMDQQCVSWTISFTPAWSHYFTDDYPGGLSKMPCK